MRDFKTAKLFIHLINESLTIYFLRRTHFILLYPSLIFCRPAFHENKTLIFLLLFLCHSSPPSLFIRHSSLVITSLFRHHTLLLLSLYSPSPWERDGERILFLSLRNPVFNIFSAVVLQYESTTYIPFLYQSSKIRISFL